MNKKTVVALVSILLLALLLYSMIPKSKYQVVLTNIIHKEGTGSFVFIITNTGNTPVFRVSVAGGSNGPIIGMTIKMESGETRMYSYTGGVAISPHGPRNNVTCQISWSMDTNSNVFIHTTQWFLV